MVRDKPEKTVSVFGPDNTYLSHCTWDRASNLLKSGRAEKTGPHSIRLMETKAQRAEKNRQIIEDAGRICYICGMYIPEDETATIDHVIPKAKDRIYTESAWNKKCCCYRCNNDKGNMSLVDYVIHIFNHRFDYDYISDQKFSEIKTYAFKIQSEYQAMIKKAKAEEKKNKRGRRKYYGNR